jgi:hypothetical protein
MNENDLTQDQEAKLIRMVSKDPDMITLIKSKYVTENLWRVAISTEPNMFKRLKYPSQELCEYALSIDGSLIIHILDNIPTIKVTDKMALIAINNNPSILLNLPREYRDIQILSELAVDREPHLLRHLKVSENFLRKKIQEDPFNIIYLENPPEELACYAIRECPIVITYFTKITDRMREVIEDASPGLLESLEREGALASQSPLNGM